MSRINYRPDDLRALQALQVTLSFVRGAEMLHISQSAFSRRITQLEAALGVSLVERSTRRVAISSAGQAPMREAARCSVPWTRLSPRQGGAPSATRAGSFSPA